MKKIQNLFHRFLNKETILYLVFGVVTTVVNYIVYYLCRFFGIHYQICNVLAWIVAVTVAYFTNKIYVFESRSFSPAVLVREIILFAGARIFSLVCEMGFMWLTVDLMGGDDRIMKLIAAVFVVIINYVFSKLFIIKSNSNKEDSRK